MLLQCCSMADITKTFSFKCPDLTFQKAATNNNLMQKDRKWLVWRLQERHNWNTHSIILLCALRLLMMRRCLFSSPVTWAQGTTAANLQALNGVSSLQMWNRKWQKRGVTVLCYEESGTDTSLFFFVIFSSRNLRWVCFTSWGLRAVQKRCVIQSFFVAAQ